MFMRNCYVILSGIITSIAVLGWCRITSENQPVAGTVPQDVQVSEQEQLPQIMDINEEQPQENQVVSWIALDELNETISAAITQDHGNKIGDLVQIALSDSVQNLSNNSGSVPVIQLATPDVLPKIGEDNADAPAPVSPKELFDVFKQDERVKTAKNLAVIDIAHGTVLEATNPQSVSSLMERISEEGDGWSLYTDNGIYKRVTWHCMDDSMTLCLMSDDVVQAKISDDQICAAAQQVNLMVAGNKVDSKALMGAENCSQINVNRVSESLLTGLSEEKGQLDVEGKSFGYAKTVLEEGLELISILPPEEEIQPETKVVNKPVVQPSPEIKQVQTTNPDNETRIYGFTLKEIGLAAGAGILVMIVGFLATRRRKENEPSQEAEDDKTKLPAGTETKDVKSLKTETTEPEKISSSKDSEEKSSESTEDNKISEPSASTTAEPPAKHSEEDIQELNKDDVQELAQEVQEINEEEVQHVDNDEVQHVEDEEVQELDEDLDAVLDAAISGEHPKKEAQDVNRVTAQAVEKVEELAAKDGANAFFEALDDDNWDEIADSFDAIMLPGQKNIENVSLKPMAPVVPEVKNNSTSLGSVFESDSDGESSFGMSGFLSAIKKTDMRNGEGESASHTETNLKPVGHDTPKINSMPSVGPVLSSLKGGIKVADDIRGTTMSGIAPRMTMPMAQAIKPQAVPELQGGNMDQNSLYDALKRRARDVSEMSSQQSNINTSGAFEYNRGLSKSGVFSVTGSRVDIDPSSDNEYFKSLYDKFLETQAECGESADKLTLEQFVSRLAREKDNLMKRYNCKNVKFSVYVKDGKASIKAIPQK